MNDASTMCINVKYYVATYKTFKVRCQWWYIGTIAATMQADATPPLHNELVNVPSDTND